jgi:YEATS domain-containing protein 1/3
VCVSVYKEPPYRIEEHGYGSFNLPIDVYFKNKEEPKKVRIDYDLFLPAMGLPAIDNIRSEALKFINPPEEFKRKVLKSGGVIVESTNGTNR